MKKLITIFTLILLSSLSAFADVENPFDVSFPIFSEADVFIKSQKIVCTGDHLFIDYVISANKVYFSSQKIMKKIHLLKCIGNITFWNTGILRMLSIPMVDMANLRI